MVFRLYFGLVFFTALLITYPLFKFYIKRGRRYDRVFGLFKVLSIIIQWLGLVPAKVIERQNFPSPPYIVVANHASYLDIVHMYSVIPSYFLFLGKSELLHWPIVRIFFKGMNIPVSRNNLRKSTEALLISSEKLSEGKNIIIFPEGGIFPGAPCLKPFKNGAFKLAIKHQVSIVPVTFLNNWKYLGDEHPIWGRARPGLAKVIIHEPIKTKGLDLKDLIPLRKECFNIIEKPLRDRYPSKFKSHESHGGNDSKIGHTSQA